MSSVMLEDTRSMYKKQLYFYTVAMTNFKWNQESTSIYHTSKRVK